MFYAALIVGLACISVHAEDAATAKESEDAQAAEMLEAEERNEAMIHREAAAYHKRLGESAEVPDDSPPAPWVVKDKEDKARKKTQQEEKKIEDAMKKYDGRHTAQTAPGAVKVAATSSPQGVEVPQGDLGESESVHADLGESESVQASAQATDSNMLTARAQAAARSKMKAHQQAVQIQRAKQIAAKVRNLVQQQQGLEAKAGQKVKGSILGKAVEEHDKAAKLSAQDVLLAHKLEDEQTHSAMEHLIETEREKQQKMFKQERDSTHSALTTLRNKLKQEQAKMVKQVRAETMASVVNVEKSLAQTSVAKTIENVVKKKLAKRIAELQNVGTKTVSDVTAQVKALKRRVRRLRREQTTMKMSEASMQQNMLHSSRDLGESSGMGNSMAMEQMRMMMMQQQQQQPQMMQQQSAEHMELMKMKEQMAQMQKQNLMLQKMVANKANEQLAQQATQTQYTHNDLQNFFEHKNAGVDTLQQQVAAEQQRLSALKMKLGQAKSASASPLQGAQMLVELSEGAEDAESATALPLYNQHAEQARVEMEELRKRAIDDAVAAGNDGEVSSVEE